MDGRTFRQVLGKFFDAPGGVCLDARVQVELPNGEMKDIGTIKLLENRMFGAIETHRLVLKLDAPPGQRPLGKIIGHL
jgi:hypothetical protein